MENGKVKISTHFLRRRAEARAKQIRRWQRDAKPNGAEHGDVEIIKPTQVGVSPSITKAAALKRLEALGIGLDWRIEIVKVGRWDARYSVVAEHPMEAARQKVEAARKRAS